MTVDILNDRIPLVDENFATGYEEMAALIKADPNMASMSGKTALQSAGLLSADFIYDNYDMWDPAADRITATRFSGNAKKFYAFRDGAELAVQTLIDSEYKI